jgi:biopolymer transport protein ExbD/biopolymer transport protein TolR
MKLTRMPEVLFVGWDNLQKMKLEACMIGFALALLVVAGGLSCRAVMPERNIDYNSGRVPVSLPRDTRYSETDRNMDKESAVIVSLPNGDQLYVGKERTATSKAEFGDKLKRLLQQQTEPDKVVYLAANSSSDYGTIVEICDEIRKLAVSRIGLLVNKTGSNFPTRLAVDLAEQPDPNQDLSRLKPNPLTLVVAISSPDLRLTLNADAAGAVNDTAPLSEWLQRIFQQRKDNLALKPGLETRTDLPLDERVEKTLAIKANRSTKYGDVVKVIDAVRGAGATPVVLQLDDLAR